MTKAERQNLWATRIAAYKESSQSVPDWCAQQNIKPGQLWYWLRKENDLTAEESQKWLSIDLSNESIQNSLLLRVGKVEIEIRPGFDPKLLLDVVKTLSVL